VKRQLNNNITAVFM